MVCTGADSDFCEAKWVSGMVQQDVGVAVLWPMMWRASGFQFNSGGCWVRSWIYMQELFKSPKEGRCFSKWAKGCYSSQVYSICMHSSLVYRTPGFHEFGTGSSSTPLDQKLTLGSTSYKQFHGIALSSYLQMPKMRLFSDRRIFVIQATRFGLLVLSLKFWLTHMLVIFVRARH